MTVEADIKAELGKLPPVEPGKGRFIIVGAAAMRALQACLNDPARRKPTSFANSKERYAIVETVEFDGWEIVDKPLIEAKKAKWPLCVI